MYWNKISFRLFMKLANRFHHLQGVQQNQEGQTPLYLGSTKVINQRKQCHLRSITMQDPLLLGVCMFLIQLKSQDILFCKTPEKCMALYVKSSLRTESSSTFDFFCCKDIGNYQPLEKSQSNPDFQIKSSVNLPVFVFVTSHFLN